jgi:hypothetical protein
MAAALDDEGVPEREPVVLLELGGGKDKRTSTCTTIHAPVTGAFSHDRLLLVQVVPPPGPAAVGLRLPDELDGPTPGLLLTGIPGDKLLQLPRHQPADGRALLGGQDLGPPDRLLPKPGRLKPAGR